MKELKIMTNDLYNRIKNNPDSYESRVNNPDKLDWIHIVWEYELSENFIREFQDRWSGYRKTYCGWAYISEYQKLSENFIREFKDEWNWDWISQIQKLSFEFIIEFIEDLDVDLLKLNKNLNFTESQWVTIENLKQMHKNNLTD